VKGGGTLYVPTPAEKAKFKNAAAPVYEWFKGNVPNGPKTFDALAYAATLAEKKIDGGAMMDVK